MKIITLIIICLNVLASQKGIYDQDDRKNYHELDNPIHRTWADATAAMIASYIIYDDEGDTARIRAKMLSQTGVCERERFARELVAADCSGFLVSEDLLVTAGHCVRDNDDCNGWRWVFDYKTSDTYQIGRTLTLPRESIFRCSEIVARKLDEYTDYAIIRLDRPVVGRTPFTLRKEGHVTKKDTLTLVGFPSGLPLKVADNARVLAPNISQTFFMGNTDSFAGNSGSPVINSLTGEVEGILVRGDEDYISKKTGKNSCYVPRVCTSQDHCEGEAVTKISEVLEFL